MPPGPVQTTTPPLSNVRDVIERETGDGLLMVSIAPKGMMVRPVPLMPPPVQVMALPTVTKLLPPREPLLKSITAGETGPVLSKLTEPPEMVRALLVQT